MSTDNNLMSKQKSKIASILLVVIMIVNLIPITLVENSIKINKAHADPTGISDGLTATNTTLANVYNSITKFFESENRRYQESWPAGIGPNPPLNSDN